MKAILFATLLATTGSSSCDSHDPVQTSSSNNPSIPVSLLFEYDGCKVYRFRDGGRERYYANCNGSVTTSAVHSEGKNSTYTETISTAK